MPRPRKLSPSKSAPATSEPSKFELIHQLGGIRTGSLDHPNPMGGQSCRVALVDTGSGLRFTVALDRGGDIVEAFFNQHSLTYLTPNGYVPPSHAYHHASDWLRSWPGGLVTTCGPRHVGQPREEDGEITSLHGTYSNTPAAIEMVLNPDPFPGGKGKREMLLSMVIRDSRMFGPTIEVRRQIQCALGVPEIIIHDQVINRGNQPVPHNWLYHVNFGYPFLDEGARFVYRGQLDTPWGFDRPMTAAMLKQIKTAMGPTLAVERGIIIDPAPDKAGRCHVGMINAQLPLAVELEYDHAALPRLANWQNLCAGGNYVTGVEPFAGSLMGKAKDNHPQANITLAPGETRRYQLTLRVHTTRDAIRTFAGHDGPVQASPRHS